MTKKKWLWLIPIILIALIAYVGYSAIQVRDVAYTLKASLKDVVSYAKASELEKAASEWDKAYELNEELSGTLNKPMWKVLSYMPIVGGDIKSARTITEVLLSLGDTVVTPGLSLLDSNPLSSLKIDDGYSASTILAYLDFVESVMPTLSKCSSLLATVKFKFVNFDVDSYISSLDSVVDLFNSKSQYVSLVKEIVSSSGTYLIAAQNSAEIRASGGFPGSIGVMTIKDGVLSLGSFDAVYNVLPSNNPSNAQSTSEEFDLFSFWVSYPRDMCYNPNFEKVGFNWAKSYESRNNEPVLGVISMTPVVIQKLLDLTDSTVELSDGSILDGTNATKVLQHDLYAKYFSKSSGSGGNSETDALFAETAALAMDTVVSNISFSSLPGMLSIFENGAKDRTVLMWFDDPEMEEIAQTIGCSGSLVPGAYFSCNDPSKLGWFVDITTAVKTVSKNEHEVTVTLKNVITQSDINSLGKYVIGDNGGKISGFIHLFAPAGGEISNIKSSSNMSFKYGEYCGLPVAYSFDVMIPIGGEVEIIYMVSGSPKFEMVHTPTLTEYRS